MMEKSYEQPDFSRIFVANVYELWRNGKLCDASMEVGSRVFKFHQIVFAVSSPDFATMDENKLVIPLPVETDISALEAVLHYVYGRELKLTQNNVQAVQELASKFKFNEILEFCETFQRELKDETETIKTDIASSGRRKSIHREELVKRSCKLKAGQKPGKGRGRGKNVQIVLPLEPQVDCTETGIETTIVLPKKETLLSKGRGKSSQMSRGEKIRVPSLLRACRLKSRCETETTTVEEEKIQVNDSLRTSPRKHKAKTKLKSDTSETFEKASQSKTQTVKYMIKDEVDSIDNPSKHDLYQSWRRSECYRPLTRAEIQRAYRARKLEKMTAVELEAFKTKERDRARKNWSLKSVSPVNEEKGKKKKVNVTKKGKGKGKATCRVKKEAEGIKVKAAPSKLVGEERRNQQRNTRQKRYRDRMKNDPEWRKKEAERTRKRYIPVSKLSKKEHKLRRLHDSERSRLWRMKKKLQTSSLHMVQDDQSMFDNSGKSSAASNTQAFLRDESGQELGKDIELVHPDHSDPCMVLVNNIIDSFNDQYQKTLVGDGTEVSEIVKKEETFDPDYQEEENVAFVESVYSGSSTGNYLDPNVDIDTPETGLCNSETDNTDEVVPETDGTDCFVNKNFRIKTEDGDVIISEADHESASDENDHDCDDDNDDETGECSDNVLILGTEEQDMVTDEVDHRNPRVIFNDEDFLLDDGNIDHIDLNKGEEVVETDVDADREGGNDTINNATLSTGIQSLD